METALISSTEKARVHHLTPPPTDIEDGSTANATLRVRTTRTTTTMATPTTTIWPRPPRAAAHVPQPNNRAIPLNLRNIKYPAHIIYIIRASSTSRHRHTRRVYGADIRGHKHNNNKRAHRNRSAGVATSRTCVRMEMEIHSSRVLADFIVLIVNALCALCSLLN